VDRFLNQPVSALPPAVALSSIFHDFRLRMSAGFGYRWRHSRTGARSIRQFRVAGLTDDATAGRQMLPIGPDPADRSALLDLEAVQHMKCPQRSGFVSVISDNVENLPTEIGVAMIVLVPTNPGPAFVLTPILRVDFGNDSRIIPDALDQSVIDPQVLPIGIFRTSARHVTLNQLAVMHARFRFGLVHLNAALLLRPFSKLGHTLIF
jgi:hypothetical protein